MSYELELFTTAKRLQDPPETSSNVHIRVDGPDKVEDEDLPQEYLPVLGKKRLLFRIHLHGELTKSDEIAINSWLGNAVAQTKGVLIDSQTLHYEAATRTGQLHPSTEPSATYGWMHFYFEDAEAFYDTRFEEALDIIWRVMPDAAPTRFGYWEPLQHTIVNGDFSQLVTAFKAETDVIMKGKTPFAHISQWAPSQKTRERYHPKHPMARYFVLGEMSFQIRSKLFAQPAQLRQLITLFEALCVSLDVVYAEIIQSDERGSIRWHGLPDHETHTICVGKTYQEVWPEIALHGYEIGQRHRIVTTDRLGNKPPQPPGDLVGSKGGRYAKVFPFDFKYDPNQYVW